MMILGVDPGISGALAALDGDDLDLLDMPILKIKRGTKAKSIVASARSPLEPR
jgi:hypothetical protein